MLDWLDTLFLFTDKYGGIFTLAKKLLSTGVIIIVCKILTLISAKLVGRLTRVALDETVAALLNVAVKYAVIIVCLIMILGVFGINTTALVALLGTAGVAVGLALKDTLGNIASGIMLIILKSYRKGDFIEFGSFMGTVKAFDLFTTTLETPDGVSIAAPNSAIWAGPVKNYSRSPRRRMDIVVGISYGDSIDAAYKVMERIVKSEGRFLTEPAPQIMVQSLGESAVNIQLRAWAPSDCYWDVYWKQTRAVKEAVEEAGLTIPFPQRDVRLIQSPPERA